MSRPNSLSDGAGGAMFNLLKNDELQKICKTVVDTESSYKAPPASLPTDPSRLQLPLRPAYGSMGRRTPVYTNYVEVQLRTNKVLWKYQIDVEPKVAGGKLSRVIELLFRKELKGRLHFTDYKSILILDENLGKARFNVVYFPEDKDGPDAESRVFHVSVEPTEGLDTNLFLKSLDPNEPAFPHKEAIVHTLNTILYHHSRANRNTMVVGKKSFPLHGDAKLVKDLGGGLKAMRGFFASVRPATSRVLVNVNVAYGIFYKLGPLLKLTNEFGQSDLRRLEQFLKGLRVGKMHLARINHQGQRVAPMRTICGFASTEDGYRLNRGQPQPVEPNPPQVAGYGAGSRQVSFYLSKPGPERYITVFDYFASVLKVHLNHPDQPVINVGTKERPIYVPMEVCEILQEQAFPMRRVSLTAEQTSAMLKMAVNPPAQNFRTISKIGIATVGLDKLGDDTQILRLATPANLLPVPARFLKEPGVGYKNQIKVMNAGWNLLNHTFNGPCQSGKITSWVWVNIKLKCRQSRLQQAGIRQFVTQVKTSLGACGVRIEEPGVRSSEFTLANERDDSLIARLGSIIPAAVEFVWIIIPEGSKILYDRIKYFSDISQGLITVVSVDNKIAKANAQYVCNEALKINLKLGGINQIVHPPNLHFIASGTTMIMGLDVTHPSTDLGKFSAPSVAGLVSSVDKYLAQWPAVLSVQTRRQEMIADLKSMAMRALESWKTKNGRYPENILVYRDGVSEGQHLIVLRDELPLIKAACQELYGQQQPARITIVVVAKRHHTRFAPTTENDSNKSGNSGTGNCKPGLVLDRGITESGSWTFFLQAHKALQGSARPGFYTVIHDEIFREYANRLGNQSKRGNAADVCEDITQSLCYCFGRATRAVGIVTPVYHADLLCDRASCYLRVLDTWTGTPPNLQAIQKVMEPHDKVKNAMFYI